jgi:hypothetical protein
MAQPPASTACGNGYRARPLERVSREGLDNGTAPQCQGLEARACRSKIPAHDEARACPSPSLEPRLPENSNRDELWKQTPRATLCRSCTPRGDVPLCSCDSVSSRDVWRRMAWSESNGPTLRLRHAGPMMSDCQPRRDPGVACSRLVGPLKTHILGPPHIPQSALAGASRGSPNRRGMARSAVAWAPAWRKYWAEPRERVSKESPSNRTVRQSPDRESHA